MQAVLDWVMTNWFGAATAIIGLWISWRLRSHPALAVQIRGYPIARHRSFTFRVRLKNVGRERITDESFEEPLRIICAAQVSDVRASRVSDRSVVAALNVRQDEGLAVLTASMKLEPGDWKEFSVKAQRLREQVVFPVKATAQLIGNRRGLKFSGGRMRGVLGYTQLALMAGVQASLVMVGMLAVVTPGLWPKILALSILIAAPLRFWIANDFDATAEGWKRSKELFPERNQDETFQQYVSSSLQVLLMVHVLTMGFQVIVAAVFLFAYPVGWDRLFSILSWSLLIALASVVSSGAGRWSLAGADRKRRAWLLAVAEVPPLIAVSLVALGWWSDTVGLIGIAAFALVRPIHSYWFGRQGHALEVNA